MGNDGGKHQFIIFASLIYIFLAGSIPDRRDLVRNKPKVILRVSLPWFPH